MKIPLLNLKKQYRSLKLEVDQALLEVINSGQFILGKAVEDFENEIANYCGVKYAIGVANGTDALLLSLKALGVGKEKNDKVITSPFTFFATAGAIVNAGAQPLFIDIEPQTYNLDPRKIKQFLEKNPKLIKSIKTILPVHLYGQIAEMKPIIKLAVKYGLTVIEDACQAIGAKENGKKAGALGDLGCFSFFPSKNLGGYGDGGMVIGNNNKLAEKIKILRIHGAKNKYYHQVVGYNSRLDALQAAILSVKLGHLDKWIQKRRQIAKSYNKQLSEIEDIETPFISSNQSHVFHQYTIRVKNNQRGKLKNYLAKKGIQTQIYYPLPLHLQKCFLSLGYKKGDFPNAEKAASEVLSLPIYPELKDREINFITKSICAFYRRKNLLV